MNVSIQPALKSLQTAALIAVVAVVGIFVGYFIDFLITDNPEVSAPEQPIAFSHKIHAGDNEIPCQYCRLQQGYRVLTSAWGAITRSPPKAH